MGERQLPSTLLETPQLFQIFYSGTCWHFSSLFCQNFCASMSCLDKLVHQKWYWQPVLCFPQSGSTSFFNFFFTLKNSYFKWRPITLQYCSGFCHTMTWISHGHTCVPHPEPPYHLPLHPIPQGYFSAPALSTLSHASNLDWRFVSHIIISDQMRSHQSLSCVRLFVTPWIIARQASLSITNSQSLLRLTCIKSVMPSSHLILCRPLLLLPLIPPSIRVFSNESTLCMRWPK